MTDPESMTALGLLASLECVVLPPIPEARPSSRPPVEIFLGTEPAQYRANRVFGYSIEKVRDPGREVRVFLMSELEGFDRRGWTTGFTNYRFAIPALRGGRGRAIYNDEDEIYFSDPGALFDLDLDGAGYLAISDTESSVMLIDCERMAPVWTLDEAQHGWKRSLLRKASRATGHRGDLAPGWNARDEEFIPGRSHLLHYTTLHTQPWRPFPERFVYQQGSYTQLWHDLEREAIARGFELFRRAAPSKRFEQLAARLGRLPNSEIPSGVGPSGQLARAIETLARQAKCRRWIELVPDLRGEVEIRPGRFGLDVERRLGLLEWLSALPGADGCEGVVCVDGLESLPVWDIPWVVDTLFESSRGFVFAAVRCQDTPRRRILHPPEGTAFTPDWWRSHFEAAAVRHPKVRWELLTTRGREFDRDGHHLARGGPRLDPAPPRISTFTDGDLDHDAQVDALANALGGAREAYGPGRDSFAPPWPELLIVAGRPVAARARKLREQAHGECLVVALGHGAALPIDAVDLAVTRRGEAIFSHPRLIEVDRPLVSALPRAERPGLLSARLAAIAGTKLVVRLDADEPEARGEGRASEALAQLVVESAARLRAAILLSGSPRCSPARFEAFRRQLSDVAFVDSAGVTASEAWPLLLGVAEVFIVVGGSDTTLAEVCATGRPVFLDLPPARATTRPAFGERMRQILVDAVLARARARPANDRGTTRPQEGLEWIAARLVARGVVRPRRSVDALRANLLASGHVRVLSAALSGADLEGFPPPPPNELERVVKRVRELLGTSPAS